MTDKYYVYIHIRDGKIIYCGKGIKRVYHYGKVYDRAYSNKGRKYNVKDVEVKKIRYFDNEQEALYFEEKLTDYLKSIGQCEYNIDSGNRNGEEHRRKMSESLKGKYTGEDSPFYGKQHSEESRKKMSKSHKGIHAGENNPMYGVHITGSKSANFKGYIYCPELDMTFEGTGDAVRKCKELSLKLSGTHIIAVIKGKRKYHGEYNGVKLTWVRL